MCSGKSLFHRGNDDNLVGEKDQERLVNWAGLTQEEKEAVLGDCKEARPLHRSTRSRVATHVQYC